MYAIRSYYVQMVPRAGEQADRNPNGREAGRWQLRLARLLDGQPDAAAGA